MKPFKHPTLAIVRAAVGLAAMFGLLACATPNHRTPEERAADQEVAGRVEDALRADPNVFARHVDVDVRRGVVWLTGWVMSADEERDAVRISKAVPGVQKVVDQIEIDDYFTHW